MVACVCSVLKHPSARGSTKRSAANIDEFQFLPFPSDVVIYFLIKTDAETYHMVSLNIPM